MHIKALEKAGCDDWELCHCGANYVLMITEPLGLLRELDKALGVSLKKLKQLKRSTLKLADKYEQLFNAPLVPASNPIKLATLNPEFAKIFDDVEVRKDFQAFKRRNKDLMYDLYVHADILRSESPPR